METTVGIVGAGAWGTALATSCARAGLRVVLWGREPELVEAMRTRRENARYLPGVRLDEAITPTGVLAQAAGVVADGAPLLLATPAQATRAMLRRLRDEAGIRRGRIVLCAKGLEQAQRAFLADVAHQELPAVEPLALSGPSFASEVARGLPAAVTLAAENIETARTLARLLSHPTFRIYSCDDLTGVQLGGALKNVLAIACGIVEGKGLGDSARAALLTRAFAEMMRFGRAMGARPETLTGLSGLGDLMLTATSAQSRNYSLGLELGHGRTLEDILGERITVAEGVFTAQVVVELARERGIDMPICESVHRIISGASDPDMEMTRLLSRPLKDETA